jgi:hypothetical protein
MGCHVISSSFIGMGQTRKKKQRRVRKRRIQKGGNPSIPIFIISWNQYTYLKDLVEQLLQYPKLQIYIIDNQSTYEPLVKYLNEIDSRVKVLRQDANHGHKVYEMEHILKFIDELGVTKYIVTDPDLKLNSKMPRDFIDRLSKLSDKYKKNKVGLALDITKNIDLTRKLDDTNQSIADNERQYWLKPIKNTEGYELYDAPIDTTFALINKSYRIIGGLHNSIRVAGDFTCVHRPWLIDFKDELIPGEHEFYIGNGNKSTTLNRWRIA